MEQKFETLEKCLDFINQLQSFGITVPPEVLAEKERLENIDDEEYIFSTMAAHNKFMNEKKEKYVESINYDYKKPCLIKQKIFIGRYIYKYKRNKMVL